MPVYPVNPNASFVSGIFTRPYIVKNSGNETVYLGQDSSLTVDTRAFSLPPGSTLNWSGTTELWACVDPAKTGEIELLFTGENSFTPGPSVVSLNRETVLLYDQVVTVPSGVNYVTVGTFPTGDYESLIMLVIKDSVATPAGTEEVLCRMVWKPADNLTSDAYWPQNTPILSADGRLVYVTKVLAEDVKLYLEGGPNGVALASSVNMRVVIYGSKNAMPHMYAHNPFTVNQGNWSSIDTNFAEDSYSGKLWVTGVTSGAGNGFCKIPHAAVESSAGYGLANRASGSRFIYFRTHGFSGDKYLLRAENAGANLDMTEWQGLRIWLPERPVYLTVSPSTTVLINFSGPPVGY